MKPVADIALGGRYRLVSRIAVGGMGEVWVGHDQALARDVAVKVLREEFAGDAGFLERFRAEARNSAQLSHPNIAQLYDYGEQDGSGFLVMELVLGEPMSDLLDRQPVLPTRRLLPILAQTARALHAAHVAGVVHRDVKPGNILLARSGRVKITDFGISTASNQVPMTASGMVMGTAQYLSPEQAIGRAATPASDVYSLGIVAYEGLVGNRPFTGPTAVDIAIAHVNTPVPPLPPDVDPALSALVMRMLAKEPEQRPRSAASLARALDELLDRTPPGGIPTPYGRHARAVDIMDAAEQDPEGRSNVRPPERRATRAPSGPVVLGPPSGGPLPGGPLPGGPAGGGPHATDLPPVTPAAIAPPTDAAPPSIAPGSVPPPGPSPVGPSPSALPPSALPPSGHGLPPNGHGLPPVEHGLPPVELGDDLGDTPLYDALRPSRPGAATAAHATVVPGRPEPEVWSATGQDVPPAYAPRDRRTDAARERVHPVTRIQQVVRTSTTTGQRWGRVSRPLVVLVLMVLFALLGAAFADRLWGPSRASGAPDAGDPPYTAVVAFAGPDDASGMIGPGAGPYETGDGPGTPGHTTTARDQ